MSRRALATLTLLVGLVALAPRAEAQKVHIAFLWHLHQPIYWPGEDAVQTANAGHYSFSVGTVHNDRTGPYTSWPRDAVAAARSAGLGRCGAQVSLTGSLMENLDAFEAAGQGFSGWQAPWEEAAAWTTDGGNPALDLIGFGFFHPLSALIEHDDLVWQIRLHRLALDRRFPGRVPSRGMFPPETAFSPRMIPALREAGVEWIIVDNLHFDRTLPDYPYTSGSNLYPPNAADQRNQASVVWQPLNGIWAPSPVSVPWGYQPHHAQYVDPATGVASDIIVVPGARYEGNEDARGGFGALQYDDVLSQLQAGNTDPDHPVLVVLHHDGDNYGGGSDSYYHANFAAFVQWIGDNSDRFECTTIEDYLEQFPPAVGDVIHVEEGSWAGADNGDPEFLKWNADPAVDGYSPDRHSWAVITAARNRLYTAAAAQGAPSEDDVLDGTGALGAAWRFLLMAEASDYWYWDNSEGGLWDSHPARAANLAMAQVDPLLAGLADEEVPPTIYAPQRQPYNPGALEWGQTPQPSDLSVWTFVYDVSDLSRVELRYRLDEDGELSVENDRYDGGAWCVQVMTGAAIESRSDPAPEHLADRYEATVSGLGGSMVDYYVEAEDLRGNVARSPIRHVWVGGGSGPAGVTLGHYPTAATVNDVITVVSPHGGAVHWGVNGWLTPDAAYWPAGTADWGDGHAVETPLTGPDGLGRYTAVLGPWGGAASVTQVDYVIHFADDTWSTPDMLVAVAPSAGTSPTVALVAPRAGDEVSGVVRVIAAAGDDDGVPTVHLLVDGAPVDALATRPYELDWDTGALAQGDHDVMVRAVDGQGNTAETTVTVTKGTGVGPGDCDVVVDPPDGGAPTDGSVTADGGPRPDGSAGRDGGTGGEGGGDGCGCQSATPGTGPGLLVLLALGAVLARRRRGWALGACWALRSTSPDGRREAVSGVARRSNIPDILPSRSLDSAPRRSVGLGPAMPNRLLALALAAGLAVGACGPHGNDDLDGSPHDADFGHDAALDAAGDASPLPDGATPDAAPDAGNECAVVPAPAGRTGTTVYLYDAIGNESAEPIEIGTEVTVVVEITVDAAPPGSIGFLVLDLRNLALDASSFELDGAPLEIPDPFFDRIPLTLAVGSYEVQFRATVATDTLTVEVDASLGFGSGAACGLDRSHSLAVLQVIGGIQKGATCYNLDQAQSVQVSPYTPLQSTQRYRDENGEWADVLIDDLVVGSVCPGPGVMVHQIEKCFTRSAASTVTLSGAAYGGDDWLVDDILLVEVLDATGDVVAAATTYQISETQVLGCCQTVPCTSSLDYPPAGPVVDIVNAVQGGGNNGAIAAGAFDLTDLLLNAGTTFSVRVTALDQGVEGRLDRVFMNVAFP